MGFYEAIHQEELRRQVKPDAQSYFLRGEEPSFMGVLAIHGFLSSPLETCPVANYLHSQGGFDVLGLRLSGHGTSAEDLATVTLETWLEEVQSAFHYLSSQYEHVLIYGISMGALLGLQLAMTNTPKGLVCLGTMLRSMNSQLRWGGALGSILPKMVSWYCRGKFQPNDSYFKRQAFVYDRIPYVAAGQLARLSRETKRRLGEVSCPLLVIHSQDDRVADPVSADWLYAQVGSSDKHLLWGEGEHVFLDHEDADNAYYFSEISRFCDNPLTFSLPH